MLSAKLNDRLDGLLVRGKYAKTCNSSEHTNDIKTMKPPSKAGYQETERVERLNHNNTPIFMYRKLLNSRNQRGGRNQYE